MRRIVLWFASSVSVLVLLFGYHTSTSGTTSATSQVAVVSGTTSSGSENSPATSSPPSTAGSTSSGTTSTKKTKTTRTATQQATKTTATKTVTGAVASTQWGPVQVQ